MKPFCVYCFRCFKCEQEIPVDINKKVQNCIDMIKKHHNDNLVFKPVERDTGKEKANDKLFGNTVFVKYLLRETNQKTTF